MAVPSVDNTHPIKVSLLFGVGVGVAVAVVSALPATKATTATVIHRARTYSFDFILELEFSGTLDDYLTKIYTYRANSRNVI